MSMLSGRINDLLGRVVEISFTNGKTLDGELKQDKKGYVLTKKVLSQTVATYFELDQVVYIKITVGE